MEGSLSQYSILPQQKPCQNHSATFVHYPGERAPPSEASALFPETPADSPLASLNPGMAHMNTLQVTK